MFGKTEIICIGSSSKDVFFPVEDGVILDTPEDLTSQQKLAFELGAKFQAEKIFEAPGGCAANVAQGLARLGVKVGCYSKIGEDTVGRWIKRELKKEGVKIDFLQTDKQCQSDLSAIIVDKNSREHLIFFNRSANENLEIYKKKLSKTKNIFVSALNGEWEKHFDNIMDISQRNGIKIFFNPGQRNISDNKEKIIEMIGYTEILILNKDEAIGILEDEIENKEELNQEKTLLKELKKRGPKIVVITDGKRGAWSLSEKSEVLQVVPTIDSAEIVDTLGAGDAFASGFLAGIMNKQNIAQSLKWGLANSLEVIKHYGAKSGLLKKNEIGKIIEKIKVPRSKLTEY